MRRKWEKCFYSMKSILPLLRKDWSETNWIKCRNPHQVSYLWSAINECQDGRLGVLQWLVLYYRLESLSLTRPPFSFGIEETSKQWLFSLHSRLCLVLLSSLSVFVRFIGRPRLDN